MLSTKTNGTNYVWWRGPVLPLVMIIIAIIGLIGGYFIFFHFKVLPPPPNDALYKQASASDSDRLDDLLARMTLVEKVGQMALIEKNSVLKPTDLADYGLGGLLSGMGAGPADTSVQGWANMVAGFVGVSRESRLGIPVLYGIDAIHGHSNVRTATIFPHLIGLGATHDAELVEKVAAATGKELSATGIRWSYSPTLDLPRDIRWGRTYEAFSDDPRLVASLGAAYVRGLQNVEGTSTSEEISVAATPKHFVGIGAMVWGSSSNQNFKIDQGVTVPDEGSLQDEFLVPFQAAVDAGALSIMVALNSWGDTKMAAEQHLVTDVLKGQLGFAGFTVSDWYGVYEIPGGDYQAAVTAINAGIDMVMLPFDYKPFIKNVTRAVRRGEITEGRIDDAVRRILRAKFALRLFDEEPVLALIDYVGTTSHRTLARQAVAQSQVLLKNENNLLPLLSSTPRLRVAGSAAHNIGQQAGAWTVEWQGIDGNWLPGATSILDGIMAAASPSTVIEYDRDGNFDTRAPLADIGIAVVGELPYAEGWGDKEFPTLSQADLEAIKRLQTSVRRVVVVIVSGRPLLVSNEIDSWQGVVAAWLPGSEGAGVADVLFGKVPFTGSLPLPWPRTTEQLPIQTDGTTADGSAVLFPRSHGIRR